jgi:hypothetical protein
MPASKATKEQLEKDLQDGLNAHQIQEKYSYRDLGSVWKALKYRGIPYPAHHFLGSLSLTPIQREFIVGTLLGDGHIPRDSPCLRVCQCFEQEEYVRWKAELMGVWVRPTGVFYEMSYKTNRGKFIQVRFSTYTHSEFSYYRNLFYPQGTKIVTKDILNLLSPFSVAIWFMDDGSKMTGKKGVRLHTASFTFDENQIMSDWFAEKYGIESKVSKISGGYPVISIYSVNAIRFKELVSPHILPCFAYKLDF